MGYEIETALARKMGQEVSMANPAKALLALCETIIEAVNESPRGLPEGHLYAALMGVGMNLDTFNKLVGILVESGKIRKEGFLLHAVK